MKRSEALSAIINKIEENFVNAQYPENACSCAGEDILALVEELGMAPPYSDAIFQKNAKVYIEPSGREWEQE